MAAAASDFINFKERMIKACVPVFIFLCLLSLIGLDTAQPQASEAADELAACERELAQSRQARAKPIGLWPRF